MSLNIRTARMSDLSILKSFEQGIVTAERPYDKTLKADPISYYDIGEMILSNDSEVAVAESDGEILASGYVKRKRSLEYVVPDYHAFIGFLYVAPAYRGRGVNKLILNHLFDWARRNNLPDIHLTVYPENGSAVRAYEKVGFEPHLLEMRLNLDETAS
ncbi:MAG: GNAT family N-acetyltransferase [Hellea sp.]